MFLWLLLPVAFLIGWYIGNSSKIKSKVSKNISLEYFKGLNFVLNEQPDKAIEVFIKMVEVDGISYAVDVKEDIDIVTNRLKEIHKK